jgi:membrane protein implicated in regulation of membrane protease activity
MMRTKTVIAMAVMITAVVVSFAPAHAVTVSAAELLENGERFSGQEVTVVGELVGDYGFRSDGTMWTQLNSDSYAIRPIVAGGPLRGANIGIGIRMPADLANDLDPPGQYRLVGPIVTVTGIWKYHDAQRHGETFLDVSALTVDTPGRDLSEHPNWGIYGAAFAFAAIAGVVAVAYVRERDTR